MELHKEGLLVREHIVVGVVTNSTHHILNVIYNGYDHPKIKMIAALRSMRKMQNKDDPWGLHPCKNYVEEHWEFPKKS